jgi:hypothetical protein
MRYKLTEVGIVPFTPEEEEQYECDIQALANNIALTRASEARQTRNGLLGASDWIELPSCRLSDAKKQEWAAYRQALRDVPQQAGFPDNIQWPSKPE